MALTSVFYDGYVTESDQAKNRGGLPEYGVYGPNDFKVTAHPSIPYAVLVKAGRAHGHGVTDTAAEDQVVQCEVLPGPSTNVRWDLITVRRNWQPALGGPSTLEALQSGATPEIPAERKYGPGVEDDQPLFLVKWQGGTSAPVQFRDLRVLAGNGGLYAKDDLVRTYLTGVGTVVNINGVEWRHILIDNDVADWVAAESAANISTFGTGWAPTNVNAHKPRLFRVGNMVYSFGGVTQGATANVSNLLTIPPAFRPVDAGTTFVGSGVTSKGVAYELVLANGVMSIPATYLTGSFPVGSVVPVMAQWSLS